MRVLILWKYNADITCLSEVRMPDSGHPAIKVPDEVACYHLYRNGVVDSNGRHAVAIDLSKAAQDAQGVGANITPFF